MRQLSLSAANNEAKGHEKKVIATMENRIAIGFFAGNRINLP